MGGLPDIVHMPNCCGEFVVSRQRVRARPRSFYQNALDIMEVRAPPAVARGPRPQRFELLPPTACAAGSSWVLCRDCAAMGHQLVSCGDGVCFRRHAAMHSAIKGTHNSEARG